MKPREPPSFEDFSTAGGFQQRQARQHDHPRAQVQGMRDKPINDLERWIGDDALAAGGYPGLLEKIADEMQRETVVDQVGGDDRMTVTPQHLHDRAAPGRGLPDAGGSCSACISARTAHAGVE